MSDMPLFWFVMLGILLAGYAILDGFDLGVGMLHLFAKTDDERRIFINSIGPLWDGNEVWLVTFGGALFAAFPLAYATVFSSFYIPFMMLLFGLIFRAISIEFRSKRPSKAWRALWDVAFFLASLLTTFLFGVAVGNAMSGIPIDAQYVFVGTVVDFLKPYPLLIGGLAAATFTMHGSLFLTLKTEGDLQKRIMNLSWQAFGIFMVFYMLSTIFTLVAYPATLENFKRHGWSWVVVVSNILAIANIPRAIYLKKPMYAFLSSSATLAALVFLFGFSLFPNLLVSSLDPEWSITIYNAASSDKTLRIMRLIAFIGLPFVLTYTVAIYWMFRGKTKLDRFSY